TSGGLWARIASFVDRHSRIVWIVTSVVLLAGALGMTQLQASGVPQSDLVTSQSEARDGQEVLGRHFPGGSGSPAVAIVDEADAEAILKD
ncbi:hypothetical protein KZ292_26355, partial [Escherichia coli]|nr:hypothetical protein [Escherichia coli]